jgi:putative heme-binding domain-containing protein
MDQVGPYEAFNGRVLVFKEGKEPVVFAEGFRAIFGMAWHDGALYVSHMPFLTVLRDTNGDGKADVRKDLFKDLGPTNNRGLNDHIVSGLQFGMDGYLYIAVGDKGIPKATGADGRTIQLRGGGTIRCRPDGSQLEVFSTGTRNHLDPNLDERDNLFTYDNTDDGDGWWTRVTHHVDGGYYGYPYDYHNRPDRMLPRMAEYGGGSPCGAVFYREDVWPEKYGGIGLWAEWGKGKVQAFRFSPAGASFKVVETIDFAVPGGVSNFHPIDLALSYDGRTLYVADWGMGGWGSKTEKVGRVFAISYKGEVKSRTRGQDSDPVAEQIKQLDHPSFNERMRAQAALVKVGREALPLIHAALADPERDPLARRHLVWALSGIAGGTPEATMPLIDLLKSAVADLRAQAARALGEFRVPIATEPLEGLLKDPEPSVQLQAVIALGRIGDAQIIPALVPLLGESDQYVSFSVRQALRRIDDWNQARAALASTDSKIRGGVLAAMEEVYETAPAKALADFAQDAAKSADERARALEYLSQVHHQSKPWDGRWWGTRPTQGKPPAKVLAWEGTDLVLKTNRRMITDPEATVRIAALQAVVETEDLESLPSLRDRFVVETDPGAKREIALVLGKLEDKHAIPLLVAAIRDSKVPDEVREAALSSVEAIGTELATKALCDLLAQADLAVERQPRVIAALGKFQAKEAVILLTERLKSPAPGVRAAAALALGKIGQADGVSPKIRPLVDDAEPDVRRSAISALGALKDREALPVLLIAAEKEETRFEASMALVAVPDTKALQVFLRGLTDKNQALRDASGAALGSIRDNAAPILDQLALRHELSPSVIPELRKVFTKVEPVAQWHLLGPFQSDAKPDVSADRPIDLTSVYPGEAGKTLRWTLTKRVNRNGRVNLSRLFNPHDECFIYGYAVVESPAEHKAQLVLGSDDSLTVWLNGKQVYDSQEMRNFEADQRRPDVHLTAGTNRILIKCGNQGGSWEFAVALATQAEHAFLKSPSVSAFDPEAYRLFALGNKGNAERGRALFVDLKGLACVKCHAVGGQGGSVGPELSSVGAKYAREELIASVLYPSAKIFSGYEPLVLAMTDGRVLTGILKSETPESIEIQDALANTLKIAKSEVEARKTSDVSIMPNGLAEGLTRQDFSDLVAYLEGLKEAGAPKPREAR